MVLELLYLSLTEIFSFMVAKYMPPQPTERQASGEAEKPYQLSGAA
jgi:hypothetical protein